MRYIFAALIALTAQPAFAADLCGSKLPVPLRSAVARAFPSFRLPVVTDNLAEDIAWNKKHGKSSCLGVAQADFDGSGTKDWLIGLTAKEGSGALVITALSSHGKWVLHALDQWPDGRPRLYVSVEPPGAYDSVLEGEPSEEGEVTHLVCSHDAALFGATESSGVVYCYSHGVWRHTWISD